MTLPDPRKALEQLRHGPGKAEEAAELPPTTALTLDVVGAHGRRFKGRWLFTVPTLGMKIDIGKLKTLYLPMGCAADPEAMGIVEVMAFLTVCCQPIDEVGKACPAPAWWDLISARDFTPYASLYGEAIEYDRRFRGEAQGPRRRDDEGAPAEDGSDGDGEAGEADDGVGDAVQAPAERRTPLAASRKRDR